MPFWSKDTRWNLQGDLWGKFLPSHKSQTAEEGRVEDEKNPV